ncbi:hypothetical protein CC78DRAFT_583629 [Lojkania enalia]|uniref:Uncharacterized protein n=1 Tax=Lojkania enalia TaxID=147567 RepID=A0A9P4K441_9PLEO|nr:hypothetical protein CC78DRAFT_583629 [Didymosphaeria enalia]
MVLLSLLATLLLSKFLATTNAQSYPLQRPYYFDYTQGICNTDPNNPDCLLILFAPASTRDSDLVVNARVTFRDTDSVQRIYRGFQQSIFQSDARNTVTMKFDIPLTNIPYGNIVTQRLYVTARASNPDCFWTRNAFYTQIHQSTVTSTDATMMQTTTSAETTTSTSILSATETTTTTPAEVTVTSITGYRTYAISITRVTTTVTCLKGHKRHGLDKRQADAVPAALGDRPPPGYEQPNCNPVQVSTKPPRPSTPNHNLDY